jgi:hypothetical protein
LRDGTISLAAKSFPGPALIRDVPRIGINPLSEIIVSLAHLALSVTGTQLDAKESKSSSETKQQMARLFHHFATVAFVVIYCFSAMRITAINIEGDEEPLRKRLLYDVDGINQVRAPFFQESFFLQDDLGRELLTSQSMSMSISMSL